MSDSPILSLILPVFNDEEHLGTILSSLLSDPAFKLEIIAVNDGSSDGTLQHLNEVAERDPRLKVFSHEQSKGPAGARNTALSHATGDWIGFVDSDDWATPEGLKDWLDYANSNSLDLLIGNAYRFTQSHDENPDPSPLLNRQPWGQFCSGKEWIVQSVDKEEWPHYLWLQLVSRKLLNNANLSVFENIAHSDILWTTQIALAAERVGFINNKAYGYRANPNSITKHPSVKSMTRRANSYLTIMNWLVETADNLPSDLAVKKALYRQQNSEAGHFLGILRKKLKDKTIRKTIARDYLSSNLPAALIKGAKTPSEIWRAIRCLLSLSYYSI